MGEIIRGRAFKLSEAHIRGNSSHQTSSDDWTTLKRGLATNIVGMGCIGVAFLVHIILVLTQIEIQFGWIGLVTCFISLGIQIAGRIMCLIPSNTNARNPILVCLLADFGSILMCLLAVWNGQPVFLFFAQLLAFVSIWNFIVFLQLLAFQVGSLSVGRLVEISKIVFCVVVGIALTQTAYAFLVFPGGTFSAEVITVTWMLLTVVSGLAVVGLVAALIVTTMRTLNRI